MSQVAVHWQPGGVTVACKMGPEQLEPLILFCTREERLTGGLRIFIDGQCALDGGAIAGGIRPLAATVSRVYNLLDSPLSGSQVGIADMEKVWLASMEGDEHDNLLHVGALSLSKEDILSLFASELYKLIVAKIERSPNIKVALHNTQPGDYTWIFVKDKPLPLKGEQVLENCLKKSGFLHVDFEDKWVSLCRWHHAKNKREDYILCDWNDRVFSIIGCRRHKDGGWNLDMKEACASASTANLARQVENHIRTKYGLNCPYSGIEDEPPAGGKKWFCPVSMKNTAYWIACDIYDGSVSPAYAVLTYVPKDGRFIEQSQEICLDSKDIIACTSPMVEKIRNFIGYVKFRHLAGVVEPIIYGNGYLLPEAPSTLGSSLGISQDEILKRDHHAPVKGALLKEQNFKIMPYDCGIAISLSTEVPPLGWLIVRRGSRLPLQAEKNIRMYHRAGAALGISTYSRKPNLLTGEIHYSTQGFYNFMPSTNKEGEAVLKVIMAINEEGGVDMTLIDVNSGNKIELQKMGILGGKHFDFPILHDIHELNGMMAARCYQYLLEQTDAHILKQVGPRDYRDCLGKITRFSSSSEDLVRKLNDILNRSAGRINKGVLDLLKKNLEEGTRGNSPQGIRDDILKCSRELLSAYIQYIFGVCRGMPWVKGINPSSITEGDINLIQEQINLIETGSSQWKELQPKLRNINEAVNDILNIMSDCSRI